MKTPWTDKVDRENPLPEYPRPQMARNGWRSLNGPWEYAINKSSRLPKSYDGIITVPFSPETELSGVGRTIGKGEFLWYRRTITVPEEFSGKRILLHFGAVDREAVVWVNSMQMLKHVGGYLPFEADITEALEGGNEFTVIVRVTDDTDNSPGTRGKQKTKRGGIWYTPQSGIWQTVWMEAVPEHYIRSLRIEPQFDNAAVDVTPETVGNGKCHAVFNGKSYPLPGRIPVPDFEAWSPEHPKLYGFTVVYEEDRVQSYFAMRKFSVEKDGDGIPRLFLNGKPYFHNGLLDQGYWPDGLYTAPTDEAMVYDIRVAKASGYNMLRKHIKVEPLRWYYHCDRYGMLVWQDMPNGGGKYNNMLVTAPLFTGIHLKDTSYALFARGDKAGRAEFKAELAAMIKHLYNCPCISVWVPFNEGWGQFDAKSICSVIRSIDRSRTIDHASGWHDQGIGELKSLHVYFRPFKFKADKKDRAVVLSEFGGYGHAVRSHCFSSKTFGYKGYDTVMQLEIGLEELYQQQIRPAKEKGLAAAVYTQLTDVEDEINGLLTYDRKVRKVDPEKMRSIINLD